MSEKKRFIGSIKRHENTIEVYEHEKSLVHIYPVPKTVPLKTFYEGLRKKYFKEAMETDVIEEDA